LEFGASLGFGAWDFARPKLRERTIDRKIDIRIDADEFSLIRFRAMIGLIVGEKTFHSPHAPA